MKMKMHHVALSVADMERSLAFYCDHFGMEMLSPVFPFEGPVVADVMGLDGARGRMCLIANGPVRLELFEFANPAPKARTRTRPVSDHGYSHFGIEVEDIEAVHARLATAGVAFHSPVRTFPGGLKAAYGRDPDGNVFEILEPPPRP